MLRAAHSKKAFKEMFLFLRGDANAKILHADDGGVFLRSKRHQDGLGLGRIFYRVGEQIGEHLTNTLRVPEDQGGKGSLDVYLMLLRCLRNVLDTVSHQGIQVKHFGAPLEFPCLNGGDIQQFIDQGDEFIHSRIHLREQRRSLLIACFVKTAVQELDIPFQTVTGVLSS